MNQHLRSAVLAAFALTSSAAFAQFNVEALVGASDYKVDCSGLTACDNKGTGFKLVAGYEFFKGLSGEVTYVDLGKAKVRDGSLSAELQSTGFGFGLRGSFPVGESVSVFARFGAASIKTEITARVGSLSAGESQSSTQPYVGFGLGYKLSPAMTLVASIDRFEGKFEGEQAAANLLGVGLNFRF